ncbi:hypothetical protein RRG08_043500 [Elysia crispata]|uniref:Uncharacterized protein n=1 Tax=Elysia crispata TaxID=231223 RepID=A0AAE0YFA4_9GAST|nr:hypothetical protein RRG08_043500 [Elysia crispata]
MGLMENGKEWWALVKWRFAYHGGQSQDKLCLARSDKIWFPTSNGGELSCQMYCSCCSFYITRGVSDINKNADDRLG